MKIVIPVFFSLVLLISCNSGTDSKEVKKENEETAIPSKEVASPVEQATTSAIPNPKCFQNDGMKYQTIIQLTYFSAMDVGGLVTVKDYNGKLLDKQRLNGTIKGNEISVRFMSKAPVIGSSSEWTKKPWTITTTPDGELLKIVFNAKDLETNQWAETVYEFKPCGTK